MLFAVLNTPHNFLWYSSAVAFAILFIDSHLTQHHRQDFLESTFPAHPKPSPSTKDASSKGDSTAPLSIRNTVLKLALDQTIGASVNTMIVGMYIHSMDAAMGSAPRISSLPKALAYFTTPGAVDLAAVHFAGIWSRATGEFWTILTAGWRLWPAVALINFTLVKTVQGRNLVGSLAGVGWGIYMSLVAAAADKEA